LLQAQLYEKFRKSRSVPASNFDFSPYQELSTGYYNFQGDRRKTFFDLDGRQVAAKTTMPYFLCTDFAQTIFAMGHKVFSDDFSLLFLGGDFTAESRADIEEVFSKEHGLFHAKEWLEQGKSIREYRPSLDRKQKRILHDELCGSRNEWIELCYKRESSVIIRFDPNSSVTEHDIDRHFASLADIKSIYLPRDLDGSLKGTASLVCTSQAAARQLLSLFKLNDASGEGHLKQHFDACGQIVFKENCNLSKIKKDFLKAAALWLYINRRIHYEEFIVPYYWPSSLPSTISKEQYLTLSLMRWHQKRLEFGKTQRQLEQDRDKHAKLQADLKNNVNKIYLIECTSMASRAPGRSPADELHDDKMMYVLVKNAGQGHTLYKWMGKQAPFKDIHYWHRVAVQEFVQSVITGGLLVNETFYETKDDFVKKDFVAGTSSSHPTGTSSPHPTRTSSSHARLSTPASESKVVWTVEMAAAMQVLQNYLSAGEAWIVFECTADSKWMEQRKETQAKDAALVQLRESAISYDIECERDIRHANQSTYTIEMITSFTKPRSLIRFGQQVFCFKANNEAQAKRLKQMLPSLDAPNHTVFWSRKKPTDVLSISDGRGSTLSVIVREDVTDASVLQFLQKILKTNVLPSICGVSEVALQGCDNTKIEWLDIEGDDIRSRKWTRRSFQFRSKITVEYQNYVDQVNTDQWERDCFYQPFSQPVTDLILLKEDFSAYRKLNFDITNIAKEGPLGENEPCMQLIVAVSDAEKIVLLVSLLNGNAQILKERKAKFDGCTVEMDQKCLANFLFSDALMNPSVKNKFQSILECGKNFWGRKISFNWYKKKNDTEVKETDSVLIKKQTVDHFWRVLTIWRSQVALLVLEYAVLSPMKEGIEVRRNKGNSGCATQMENISCCYCGCNYVISSSVKRDFGDGMDEGSTFCCISHVDFSKEVQTKLQLPISRLKKSDKEISRQAQDPARDKNLANLFRRIRDIEKLLLLNISAGAQHRLFFKCSETNMLTQLRMQCRFRRDKYDGPVHLSFCIEGPTAILCSKKGDHEAGDFDQPKEWSLKTGLSVTISLREPIDEFAHFSTTLSVEPEFYEHETPLLFGLDISNHKMKTHMSRVYGRLASKQNGKDNGISSENEGNKLPAEWMRRVMEPEYYQCTRPVYPVVEFKLTVPENDDANDSVSSARASLAIAGRAYYTAVPSHYFDEHGLPDKHSKQDLKPKKATLEPTKTDEVSQAVRCFREVLKVESKLNDLNSSLNQLNQQIGACLNAAKCELLQRSTSTAVEDLTPCVPSDLYLGDDSDQGSDDDDNWTTGLFDESSIPQGWVVLLRSSSTRDGKGWKWMELFYARKKTDPHIFEQSDIIRVIVELPAPKENAKFQRVSSSDLRKDFPAAESASVFAGEAAGVADARALSSLSPLSRLKSIFVKSDKSKKFIEPRKHFESLIATHDSGSGHVNVTFTQDAWQQLQELERFHSPNFLKDSPLLFVARSFIDYVISTTSKKNTEHNSAVPICVFKQNGFPVHLSNFIFRISTDRTSSLRSTH
jgi:hypothetical protein